MIQAEKKEKSFGIYWEGDDTDLKVPRVGDRTASRGSSFQSLTAGAEGVASVVRAAAEVLVLELWWLLLRLAGWSLRSGHLTHALLVFGKSRAA